MNRQLAFAALFAPAVSTLAAFALSACAGSDVVDRLQPPGYVSDAADIAAQADWSAPETVTVQLSNYQFSPDELRFHRDRATRLVLVNVSDSDHTFVSKPFFSGIAVKQLLGPDQAIAAPWVEKVVVPAGQTKELWFVPVRYGAYKFECTVAGHATLGMTGLINVE
jgi:uncharacterized cupredoxin-like copper-binding protein